jgi:hypothetical protein
VWQVGGFLLFPAPIKLTAMIQLKVALSTISLNPIRIHCFHLMTEKNTLDYTNIIIVQNIFEFFRSLLFYWGVWNASGRAEVPCGQF